MDTSDLDLEVVSNVIESEKPSSVENDSVTTTERSLSSANNLSDYSD